MCLLFLCALRKDKQTRSNVKSSCVKAFFSQLFTKGMHPVAYIAHVCVTVPNTVAATRPVHECTFSKSQVLVYMLTKISYRSIPSEILTAHTE